MVGIDEGSGTTQLNPTVLNRIRILEENLLGKVHADPIPHRVNRLEKEMQGSAWFHIALGTSLLVLIVAKIMADAQRESIAGG